MKTGKLFTIDVEIAEKLQNINASQLVNGLLKEYFDVRSDKNTLKEEKKAVFDAISKKKSNFLKKLKLLMSGMHLVLIIFARHGLKQGWRCLQLFLFDFISMEDGVLFLKKILSKPTNFSKKMEKS